MDLVVSAGEITALVTVQVPEAARQAYPDEAIRTALMTSSVRPNVPAEEQLSLLPFRVSELAGFKIGGVIAGRAVMLTDGALEPPATGIDTHIVVAIAAGAPAQAADRGRFAHEVFARVPEPEGHPHQLVGDAAHRRHAGSPDHGARKRRRDRRRGHDRAVAALRRQRLSAPGRGGAHRTAGRRPMPAFGRCATGLS